MNDLCPFIIASPRLATSSPTAIKRGQFGGGRSFHLRNWLIDSPPPTHPFLFDPPFTEQQAQVCFSYRDKSETDVFMWEGDKKKLQKFEIIVWK